MSAASTSPSNQYGFYKIPDGLDARPASKAVLKGEVYEPKTIRFMCDNAGDGDIVHAGAFFGDFIPALAKGVAKGRKVWAFEPNPGNYACAAETVKLNKLKNVELSNVALSDRESEIFFRTHRKNGAPLGGLSRFVEKDGQGVQRVDAVMLDYAVPIDRKISLLQLDVEGHEGPAILGAYHIIRKWQPILILEYFDHQRWITRTFRGLGYKKVAKVHGNTVFANGPVNL